MLQPIFLGLTTFLFLRNLGLKSVSAVFGGLGFALSGFSVVWMEYNTIDYALIFFPLTLFCIDKIVSKPKTKYAFILAITLALQIFSGYPQVTIYTLLFSLIYFGYRLYSNREFLNKKIGLVLLGIGSGLFLASIQVISSLELIRLSIRDFDKTATTSAISFVPLQHLVTFFVPDFFGNPATGNYFSSGSYDNFAFSLPSITIFFAVLILSFKDKLKKYSIFWIMALVSLLLAIDNPISRLVSSSAFFGLKSAVAARVLFVFDFSAVVLSSVVLDNLIELKKLSLSDKIRPLLVYLGILLGIILSILFIKYQIKTSPSESLGIAMRPFQANLQITLRNWVIVFVPLLLVTIAILVVKTNKLIFISTLVLLTFNIYFSADKYLPFVSSNLLYPSTEATTYLQNNLKFDRFDRESAELIPQNTWTAYGLKGASGQNALALLSTNQYFSLINTGTVGYITRFSDLSNFNSPLYNTLDIRYLTVLNRGGRFSAKL